jgi:hypothetical protein
MDDKDLDMLIVEAFWHIEDDEPPEIDISILTDEDRAALDALGPDLVDRLIAKHSCESPQVKAE